jgi:predicted MFS family arabinose efflux permease
MPGARPLAVIVAMCVAHVCSMTGFAAFPSLLPVLQPLWDLSNTEAGWINGIFFAGYVSAVPVMVSLTDRVDARLVYLTGLGFSVVGLAGFALAAHDFTTGLLWHAVAGIGVGSTYMTGLKVMTDRLTKPAPSRAIAVYAAMFSTGAAASFALNGAVSGWLGWQAAFALAAAGPALAIALALIVLRPRPPDPAERPQTALLDFRPVLKNRTALGYMLGYAGHSWELFALRGWLVAFLVYAGIGGPGESGAAAAAGVAAAASLAGVPATILGNEAAQRFGRRRVILCMMTAATLISCFVGFAAGLPAVALVALVFAYSVAIMGDSGSLTAGTAGAAAAGYGGATLALHSILGFGGAFFGPLAVGLVLDIVNGDGAASTLGWGLAFITMGLGSAAGGIGLVWMQRQRRETA